MTNNSKAKGDRLEDAVCSLLTAWVHAGSKDVTRLFIRVPGSGAIATKEMRNSEIAYFDEASERKKNIIDPATRNDFAVADVYPTHPKVYPFSMVYAIECKNYETVPWGRLLFTPEAKPAPGTVKGHWEHLVNLCLHFNRIPWLVYKETKIRARSPVLLVHETYTSMLTDPDRLKECAVGAFPRMGLEAYILTEFLSAVTYPASLVEPSAWGKMYRNYTKKS